jgi:hypothetical protein
MSTLLHSLGNYMVLTVKYILLTQRVVAAPNAAH